MAIRRQEKIIGLELELGALGRGFLELVVTGKILRRLVLFYKSN